MSIVFIFVFRIGKHVYEYVCYGADTLYVRWRWKLLGMFVVLVCCIQSFAKFGAHSAGKQDACETLEQTKNKTFAYRSCLLMADVCVI